MRSRYTAYATGAADYIVHTTTPGGPQWMEDREAWLEQIRTFAATTRFEGLRIVEAPTVEGDEGFVTFEARLSRQGRDVSFVERSRFVRLDGRWTYHSGEPA
ncbi:MAG: hypothetical protein KTR31_02350 [Myxococcales bacterium]|nr:hypothetical protein [Myxococcales bacterium]